MSGPAGTGEGDDVVLGVAIALPEPHATVLTRWRRRIADPAAELVFPHVTLLPPTTVHVGDLDKIEDHLGHAATTVEPFTMHLAGTGTFRPVSPVVYVQVAAGVAQCELLETAIRRGPVHRELDFPYHPHVTVGQDVDEGALDDIYDGLAGFVARFPVDRFVLFTRAADGGWQWRTEFPLGTAEGPTS